MSRLRQDDGVRHGRTVDHARDRCSDAEVAAIRSVRCIGGFALPLIREDYHERLEEDFLFPRFERAARLVDLVTVLRTQHQRGRALTADILAVAAATDRGAYGRLRTSLHLFIRMYRPHEAREDTVLFPAFHEIVTRKEYEELGEMFEEKEHALFGPRGFEGVVDEVARAGISRGRRHGHLGHAFPQKTHRAGHSRPFGHPAR